MKGHFRKRGDKWYFWAELGTDGDGKRQQVSRGGFRTRREAEAAFAAMRDELRKGTFVSETKTSVRAFLEDEWLPAIRVSIRPSTLDNYSSAMTRYVIPRIGGQQLGRVTPAMLNALYADLLATGRSGGLDGLSPKTVKEVHTIVHKALHDAVRWGPSAGTRLTLPILQRHVRQRCRCGARTSYGSSFASSSRIGSTRCG